MKNLLKIVFVTMLLSSSSFAGKDMDTLDNNMYSICINSLQEADMPNPVKNLVCKCTSRVIKSTLKNDANAKIINTGKYDQAQDEILSSFIGSTIDMCNTFGL